MTISKKDLERLAALADLEERPEGTPTGGESAFGADAAAIGQQLLTGALGATAAQKATRGRGRPNVGGAEAGEGESPTLRARVDREQRAMFLAAAEADGLTSSSEALRAAITEYIAWRTPLAGPDMVVLVTNVLNQRWSWIRKEDVATLVERAQLHHRSLDEELNEVLREGLKA